MFSQAGYAHNNKRSSQWLTPYFIEFSLRRFRFPANQGRYEKIAQRCQTFTGDHQATKRFELGVIRCPGSRGFQPRQYLIWNIAD
jgi:hypothetical protein